MLSEAGSRLHHPHSMTGTCRCVESGLGYDPRSISVSCAIPYLRAAEVTAPLILPDPVEWKSLDGRRQQHVHRGIGAE